MTMMEKMRYGLIFAIVGTLFAGQPVYAKNETPVPIDITAAALSQLLQPLLEQSTKPRVQPAACCKICRKGKACGNSCISRKYRCTDQPPLIGPVPLLVH